MGCVRIVVSDLWRQLDAFFVAVEVHFAQVLQWFKKINE